MFIVHDARTSHHILDSEQHNEPAKPLSIIEFLVTHPNPTGAEVQLRSFSEGIAA
jgi:hypothetical protein